MGTENGRQAKVRLTAITLDPRLQPRLGMDRETVEAYTEVLTEGGEFAGELPRVYDDGTHKWLADGWHRYEAHKAAGRSAMECRVIPGTFDDAFFFAVQANHSHGKPRTQSDKRRAIRLVLEHPKGQCMTTREVADRTRTGRQMVETERKKMLEEKGYEAETTRIGRDGREHAAHKPAARQQPAPESPTVRDDLGRAVPVNLTAAFVAREPGDDERPHAVCPACSGTGREAGIPGAPACRVCRVDKESRGWLDKEQFDGLTNELKEVAGQAGATAPAVLRDALGAPVPEKLLGVFGQASLAPVRMALDHALAATGLPAVLSRARKIDGSYGAWLKVADVMEAVSRAIDLLKEAESAVRAGVPYAVHADCQGAGCEGCRNAGWLPEWRHTEVSGANPV
ncbi:MAG TPA: hypothetical protein VEI97_08230 [bacterium]|nr:hypothetical protein [bacterium]